jgi:hypothetical protein
MNACCLFIIIKFDKGVWHHSLSPKIIIVLALKTKIKKRRIHKKMRMRGKREKCTLSENDNYVILRNLENGRMRTILGVACCM